MLKVGVGVVLAAAAAAVYVWGWIALVALLGISGGFILAEIVDMVNESEQR